MAILQGVAAKPTSRFGMFMFGCRTKSRTKKNVLNEGVDVQDERGRMLLGMNGPPSLGQAGEVESQVVRRVPP